MALCSLLRRAVPVQLPRAPSMAQRFSKAVRDQDMMLSRARVYTDVNVNRPKEYWDYEALQIQWG